jgi:hypothetical protein
MRYQLTRDYYIPKGATRIADDGSDAVAYLHTDRRERPCAAIFFGKQAKPIADYAYRDAAAREDAVRRAFEGRRAHAARVAETRSGCRKSPTALRNVAAKRALEARYGKGTVSVRNGRGTAYGWLHINFSFPKPRNDEGKARAEVLKVLATAGIQVGKYDSSDYGSGYELTVNWADAR